MAGNLTIGALLTQGTDRLRAPRAPVATAARPTDTPTHTLDAELLLAHTLSKTRTHLKTHPEYVPSPEQAQRYAELIERRAAGEPKIGRAHV